MGLIRLIKKQFGIYDPDHEYWIYTKDIQINPAWRKTLIGEKKWKRKKKYWYRTGEFQSKIILDRNFNLVDGYSSYMIAKTRHIDKVPVYFAG